MRQQKSLPSGFTLLEMIMIITIAGLMMVAGLDILKNYTLQSRAALTKSRLQDIDTAIIQYLGVNNALPCPAELNDTPGFASLGRQLTDVFPAAADCYAAAGIAPPNAAFRVKGIIPGKPPDNRDQTTNKTGFIVTGAVPIKALGLPGEDMFDAWGDRFAYSVTNELTISGGYDETQGSITVQDSNGNHIAVLNDSKGPHGGAGQYVLLSFGPDRAGAYTRDGNVAVACPSSGELESTNCAYGDTYIKTTLNSNRAGSKDMYDDYVTFQTQINAYTILPLGTVAIFNSVNYDPPGCVCPPLGPCACRRPVCPAGWWSYQTRTGQGAYCGDAVPAGGTPAACDVTETFPNSGVCDFICCIRY